MRVSAAEFLDSDQNVSDRTKILGYIVNVSHYKRSRGQNASKKRTVQSNGLSSKPKWQQAVFVMIANEQSQSKHAP
eukprot:6213247-Pleurochrysis_carterae.AAC.9